jgi:MFS family permease
MNRPRVSPAAYGIFLIGIAGFGGLLYGVDIGVIAAALLYLSKTVQISITQTSAIVAAVLAGSMVSSLLAGLLADWLGRKRIMVVSGAMFITSVLLIVLSNGFTMLLLGRLLQGMSGGVIAVVVPLYLAECLGANTRGRGTAVFQLLLTFGIVIASLVGVLYTHAAENAIAAAGNNQALVLAAENHAWRGMFLATIYPGLIFLAGTLLLVESPRWLYRKGRVEAARDSLHRLLAPEEAELQLAEMQTIAAEKTNSPDHGADSLLRRKYVVPFLLACVVLACTQATGINSILQFLVVILKQAGMSPERATQGDLGVKIMQCIVTVAAVLLVDRKGRRFLLRIGTGGLMIALLLCAVLFHTFESQRQDVKAAVQTSVHGNKLQFALDSSHLNTGDNARSHVLTVLYNYGHGSRVATLLDTDASHQLTIEPEPDEAGSPLVIQRASYGPVASQKTGWLITLCLALFVSFFALGPGVVVWLMLSELMPTRIRSTGMGIALLINQGVSTAIAAVFLPTVGNYGFYAIFLFWAACTLVYFLTATFLLPETKGRTLEEIEEYFEAPPQKKSAAAV